MGAFANSLSGRDNALKKAEKDTHSAYPSNIYAINKIYTAIYSGQPTHYYGFPPSLYHPALAALQYDLEASDNEGAVAITSHNRDIFHFALEFFRGATESARNEDERWNKMQGLLLHIFGNEHRHEMALSHHSTALKPDVVWGKPAYIILELKTDPGVLGDASLQAVRAYIHECSFHMVCGLVPPSIQHSN